MTSPEDLEEGTRSRVRRGQAQGRLREACQRLLGGVTLDDLTAFVTVARLTEESGVSSGAIYSAVDGGGGRSAPQELFRDVFLDVSLADDQMVLDILDIIHASIDDGADRSATFIETIAALATDPVVTSATSPDRVDYTHFFLSAAVALNDPEVRESMGGYLRDTVERYQPLMGRVLELSGRTVVAGADLLMLSQMLTAAGDGAAVMLRLDPTVGPDIVRRMFLAVFTAMTRGADDIDDLFTTRLAGDREPATADQVASIRQGVIRLAEREGWAAVTLARVGSLTGVPESAVVSVFPTRHHLAPIVWDEVVAVVERRDRSRVGLDPVVRLRELVADLTEAACTRRSLVSSLLAARLHDATRTDVDRAEPVSVRCVELLSAILGTEDEDLLVASRMAVDALLMGAAVSESAPDRIAAVMIGGLDPVVRRSAGTAGARSASPGPATAGPAGPATAVGSQAGVPADRAGAEEEP